MIILTIGTNPVGIKVQIQSNILVLIMNHPILSNHINIAANTGGWKNYGQHNNMNSGSSNTEPANNQQWYPYYQVTLKFDFFFILVIIFFVI